MAQTIDYAFVQAFQDQISLLFQEDSQEILSTVRRRNINAKFDHWERLGGVELVQVLNRHQQTPHTPMLHSRRRAVMTDWAGAEYLDQLDQVKLMIDPRNEYTQNLLRAWRRRVARTTLAAIIGTATTVDNVDATGSQAMFASQQIANGGSGFTFAKLRQANRILDNAGVPRDGRRTVVVSAYAIEDLMADTQFTSADYNTLNTIMTGGRIEGTFMGMKWVVISDAVPDASSVLGASVGVPSAPVLPKAGNIRSCMLYHQDAAGLSVAMDVKVEIDQRPDLMNSWQVLVKGSFGAVRILDEGVVQIDFDESV